MVSESGGDQICMREWLDGVKPGFGERFATCFADLGCDDTNDLTLIGAREWRELASNLRKVGVHTIHLKRIKTAIGRLRGGKMTTERFLSHIFISVILTEIAFISSKREDEFEEISMYGLAFAFTKSRTAFQGSHQFSFTMKRSKRYRSAVDCTHCH